MEPETLAEAKKFLRDNWEKGTACPCCGQHVRQYKRPLYGTIAVNLIRLYRLDWHEPGYHHITKILIPNSSGGGDFAKLTYWGLVEEQPKDANKSEKRTSGMWRITAKGMAFVSNVLTVQSHAVVYDGKFLGLTGDQVSIKDVLGKKFNYEELMSNIS